MHSQNTPGSLLRISLSGGYRVFSSRERADRFVQGQWQTLSQELIEQTVANIRQIRRDEIPEEHYVSLDENVPVTWAALLAVG